MLKLPWYIRYGVPALLLVACAVLAQRALVHYGDDRVREAVAPWLAAQVAWKAQAKANDATNRTTNDAIRRGHEADLARFAAERDGIQRMLDETRGRGRRIEEAYRLALADERGRVAASSATVAGLVRDIEAARGSVDTSLAAYDQSCRNDAVTLTSLQGEVRPWVTVE